MIPPMSGEREPCVGGCTRVRSLSGGAGCPGSALFLTEPLQTTPESPVPPIFVVQSGVQHLLGGFQVSEHSCVISLTNS
jgi:hypothetical protein